MLKPGFPSLVLAIAAMMLTTIPCPADWPTWQQNPAHTGAGTSSGPVTNNLLWTYTYPDDLFSSDWLAVADGRVFVTGLESFMGGEVVCLDADTGDFIWDDNMFWDVESPTVADGKLYTTSSYYGYYGGGYYGGWCNVGIIYCSSAAYGGTYWGWYLEYCSRPYSPVVAGGVAVTAFDYDHDLDGVHYSRLVAINAATGHELWKYTIDGNGYHMARPAIANGRVYSGWSGGGTGATLCLDLSTGCVVWLSPFIPDTSSVTSSLAIENGKVHLNIVSGGGYELVALDEATGDLVWSQPETEKQMVSVTNEALFTSTRSGRVASLNPDTGETNWTLDTPASILIDAPAVGGGLLYLAAFDSSGLFCIDAESGEIVWTDCPASYLTGAALSGGRLYVTSGNQVFCYEDASPLGAQLTCVSPHHAPPGGSVAGIAMTNLLPDSTRRFDYQVNVTDPDGSTEINWHRGWQNVHAGETWSISWPYSDPALEQNWGPVLFELVAADVTPAPWNQPPYPPSGEVVHDSCTVDFQPIYASLFCEPSSGTLPFASQFDISMTNGYPAFRRRLQYEIAVTLANEQYYSNWRRGWQNVPGGGTYSRIWWQAIPDSIPLLGLNHFDLKVIDVTPAPYNLPPYPPAGNSGVDNCTITASGAD